MHSVNIAHLKNHFSRYLKRVRRGEEILICDRDTPIAKLVPLPLAGEFDQQLLALAAAGLVRLPEKRLDLNSFRAMPGPHISMKQLVAAVIADREED